MLSGARFKTPMPTRALSFCSFCPRVAGRRQRIITDAVLFVTLCVRNRTLRVVAPDASSFILRNAAFLKSALIELYPQQ